MSYFQVLTTCLPQVLMTWHFDYCPSTSEGDNESEGPSAPVISRWLWPENKTFLEVASMVVTWWIVAFDAVSILINTEFLSFYRCQDTINITLNLKQNQIQHFGTTQEENGI